MPILDYRLAARGQQYSRWGAASICVSLGGLALCVVGIATLPVGAGTAVDLRQIAVLIYIGCLILGFFFSAIGYFKDDRQKTFCFLAFLVSLLQVLAILLLALVGTLLGGK